MFLIPPNIQTFAITYSLLPMQIFTLSSESYHQYCPYSFFYEILLVTLFLNLIIFFSKRIYFSFVNPHSSFFQTLYLPLILYMKCLIVFLAYIFLMLHALITLNQASYINSPFYYSLTFLFSILSHLSCITNIFYLHLNMLSFFYTFIWFIYWYFPYNFSYNIVYITFHF